MGNQKKNKNKHQKLVNSSSIRLLPCICDWLKFQKRKPRFTGSWSNFLTSQAVKLKVDFSVHYSRKVTDISHFSQAVMFMLTIIMAQDYTYVYGTRRTMLCCNVLLREKYGPTIWSAVHLTHKPWMKKVHLDLDQSSTQWGVLIYLLYSFKT